MVERGPQLLHRPAGLDPACAGPRWPCGAACDADTYDDGLFLFYPEAHGRGRGPQAWADLQPLATARHEYYDHYNEIRDDLAEDASARCPTRSRTRSSSRSSACTTTTSRA